MDNDTKERISEKEIEINTDEELIVEITAYLIELEREKRKIFIKNSNGVYRDEIEQFKAETSMNIINEIIAKMYELRGKINVSNDERIGNTLSGEGEEKEEVT